jgi:hypothetical protein
LRDPWKVLALLLAIALTALILLRMRPAAAAPEQARSQETAGAFADSPTQVEGLRRSEVRAGNDEAGGARAAVNLLVRFVDEAGESVAASCTARLPDGSTIHSRIGGGTCILYDLPPGEVRLKSYGKGFFAREEQLLLAPAPDVQQHEMALERSASIPVTFLIADGRRLSAALRERFPLSDRSASMPYLFATRDGVLPQFSLTTRDEFSSPHAQWSSQSLFGDPSDPDGTLSVWSRPPLMLHVMMRHREIGRFPLEGLPAKLDLVVDLESAAAELATVRVRVLDGATGAPVKDGSIQLLGGRMGIGLARIGDDGTFERAGLPSGLYDLLGYFGEAGRFSQQIVLQPGEHLDLGTIRTSAPGSFTIRYHTPDGVPIPGASGSFWNHQRWPRLAGSLQSALVGDPAGVISVEGLQPGEYAVTLTPPGDSGWAVAAARCTVPSAAPVEVVARPGALVTFSGGEEEYPRHLLWILVEGFAPVRGPNYSSLPLTLRLAAGRHVWILVDAGGAEVRRGEVEVREPLDHIRVELPLP